MLMQPALPCVLRSRYQAFRQQMWSGTHVPTDVLQLCRAYCAIIHGAYQPEAHGGLSTAQAAALLRHDVSEFSAGEHAALTVCAKVPLAHHEVSDAEIASLIQHFGEAGTVSLLVAIAFFDVECRMGKTMGQAFAAELTGATDQRTSATEVMDVN